jgi:cobaltochelatase CobN
VLIQFHGRSVWLHSINSPEDVDLIYGYIERMLREDGYLDPPAGLAGRRFQRYLVDSAEEAQCSAESC